MQPLAAHRQEGARAVRDPHPQAAARHRRSDAADRGRADEARPRRRRRRRDQALMGALPCMRTGSDRPEAGHDPRVRRRRQPRAGHRAAGREVRGRGRAHRGEGRLHRRPARRRHAPRSRTSPSRSAATSPRRRSSPSARSPSSASSADALLEVGAELSAGHFVAGQYVDVTGTTIGKGFAGAMKRHNFGGLRATPRRVGLAPQRTARPATARIPARSSRARRWPATWATSG